MNFAESKEGKGQLQGSNHGMAVPCFPLESILLAINQTHVDYFSLDVEGYELPILKTIPFDKIQIDTLSVEYVRGPGGSRVAKQKYKHFMESKGYRTHADIQEANAATNTWVNDLIFVKKEIMLNE